MLVLTRKAARGAVIDNRIIVRVLAVDGDHVKTGFGAPERSGYGTRHPKPDMASNSRAVLSLEGLPRTPTAAHSR